MIQAIIFDCFGVLVEASLEPFYRKYFGDDHIKIARSEERMHAANRGEITFEDYVRILAVDAGISDEEVQKELDKNPRNEALLSYIKESLKPKFKIGFLSNASDNWLDELFLPDDLKLFDALVLSYETGYAKPEAPIYQITADKLGLRLEECLFVDDRQDYIDGATAVGMKGIMYNNMPQLKNDIERMLKENA